jgi:ABC-type Fe3+/spermidine/putrescine transport system ATPase subunit
MADQVALIERGALVAHGAPHQLYTRPPTRRAARQMGVDTFLCGERRGATLHSQLGPLTIADRPAADGRATYAIRPEQIRLLAHPAENTVAATLRAQTFRGDYLEILLCAGEGTLRAHASQPCACAPGDPIYAQLPAEHLFPVDEDEGPQERTT